MANGIKSASSVIDRIIRQKKRELRKVRSALSKLDRKVKRVAALKADILTSEEKYIRLEEQVIGYLSVQKPEAK